MEDADLIDTSLFETPEGFLPEDKPLHYTSYVRKADVPVKELKLRLVGSSPLWGHLLWNAGIYTADYLDKFADELVKGKNILELGAAAGLPSVICGLNHCKKIVSTDYPDSELIENLKYNVEGNKYIDASRRKVMGYIWGNDVKPLLSEISGKEEFSEEDKFDLIVLSDLVFNHTEHHKLLSTCRKVLKRTGKCFVVFSPHRPHLLDNDLEFFKTCEEHDFKSESIELVNWKPMFEEDKETEEIRGRVYSFFLLPQW